MDSERERDRPTDRARGRASERPTTSWSSFPSSLSRRLDLLQSLLKSRSEEYLRDRRRRGVGQFRVRINKEYNSREQQLQHKQGDLQQQRQKEALLHPPSHLRFGLFFLPSSPVAVHVSAQAPPLPSRRGNIQR